MSSCSATRRLRASLDARVIRSIETALARLRADGVVAFPSETVWGLAACASSEAAVTALLSWKGRGRTRPISLLVSGPAALRAHGFELSPLAEQLVRAFWPGPLTLVLPCRGRFASGIARADGAVGVRCSCHPVAGALACAAEEAGLGLLTATSLNRTGETPVQCENEARALCGDGPDEPHVVEAGIDDAGGEPPTSVVDLAADPPAVIRWGGLGPDALRPLLEPDRARLDEHQAGEKRG